MSGTARRLVALTFDYETWQPIPPGKRIDKDVYVFEPPASLGSRDPCSWSHSV